MDSFAVGDRVVKSIYATGDRHALGAFATIVAVRPLGYVVQWDGEKELSFVVGSKLRLA
jgi:hypothetical protein